MSTNDLFLDRICYIKKLLLHVFWELEMIFENQKLHERTKWKHLFYGLDSIRAVIWYQALFPELDLVHPGYPLEMFYIC